MLNLPTDGLNKDSSEESKNAFEKKIEKELREKLNDNNLQLRVLPYSFSVATLNFDLNFGNDPLYALPNIIKQVRSIYPDSKPERNFISKLSLC
jgi:hypothetical protein